MQPLSIAVLAVSLLFVPSLQAAEFEQPGETVRGELQGVAEPEGAECSGVGWPVNYWPEPVEVELPTSRLGLRNAADFPESCLPPVDVAALLAEDEADAAPGKPLRIGVLRELDVDGADGDWSELPDGGSVWTAAVVLEGAFGVRLHFRDVELPPGAALYVYAAENPAVVRGPYEETGPHRTGAFWTAPVEGESAYVEYYVPAGVSRHLPFIIDEAVHTYRSLDGTGGSRAPLDCMGDVACYPDWEDVSYAVAKITYVNGGSYQCTGTLLASANGDLTPYFLTSAHCIDEQSVADTVDFRWFYQHATCGGSLMSSQYSNDATLLDTSGASNGADWTLLMVDGALPAGVFWSGWMTTDPPPGTWSVGVHHPDGSWKRYSKGQRYNPPSYWSSYHELRFDNTAGGAVGHIYFGSSGSGIWRESDQKLFGNASFGAPEIEGCDDLSNRGYYGRFSTYYPSISTYLAGGSDDALEENDSCVEAALTGNGSYPDLVVKSLDEDWYRISLNAGLQLTATLTFVDVYGNIDAELYDVCGGAAVASATTTTNNEQLTYINPGPQADFYLRVYLSDDTRNTYDMTLGGAMPNPCDGVTTMNDGDTYSGTLNLGGPWTTYSDCVVDELGQEKVYRFTTPYGGIYALTGTTVAGDPDFYLMSRCDNLSTNLLEACWDEGVRNVSLEPNTSYYVIVDNASDTVNAEYEVQVDFPPDPCDSITVLSKGVPVSDTVGTEGVWTTYPDCIYVDAGGEHVYSFTTEATGTATLAATTISGDPNFYLMESCGVDGANILEDCWDDGLREPALAGGTTYYIIVDNASGSTSAEYTLQVDYPIDDVAPTPNPMYFYWPPVGASSSSVSMEGATATDLDSPPVTYQFEFVSGGAGGTTSDWQLSPNYSDTDLDPNTDYTYVVRARDSALPQNVTEPSDEGTGWTLAVTPGAPILSNPTCNSMEVDIDPGDNPSYTGFAIECWYTNPTHGTWDDQWVGSNGFPSATPVWRSDTEWGVTTIRGLCPSRAYYFYCYARNHDLVETGHSPFANLTTTAVGNGDFDADGDVDLPDFGEFQICFDSSPVGCACAPGDMNNDDTIDLDDYALFHTAFFGP